MRRFFFFLALALLLVSSAFAVTLKITWDPANSNDIFGYRVHWGTSSRNYNNHIDVGKNFEHQIDDLHSGVRYYCAVTAVDYWGKESDYSTEVSFQDGEEPPLSELPTTWELAPGYPNPFQSGKASILKLEAPTDADVSLAIFNILGQKVRTLHHGSLAAGRYAFSWDGTDDNRQFLPSAIYFYHLQTDNGFLTQSVFLIH